MNDPANRHSLPDAATGWVKRWAPLIPERGTVLDLACGRGRNARYLADLDAGRKPVVEEEDRKPSGDAAKELRMAKMLIMTKATDTAREKLQAIVANYPGSSEAEEARKLLSEME